MPMTIFGFETPNIPTPQNYTNPAQEMAKAAAALRGAHTNQFSRNLLLNEQMGCLEDQAKGLIDPKTNKVIEWTWGDVDSQTQVSYHPDQPTPWHIKYQLKLVKVKSPEDACNQIDIFNGKTPTSQQCKSVDIKINNALTAAKATTQPDWIQIGPTGLKVSYHPGDTGKEYHIDDHLGNTRKISSDNIQDVCNTLQKLLEDNEKLTTTCKSQEVNNAITQTLNTPNTWVTVKDSWWEISWDTTNAQFKFQFKHGWKDPGTAKTPEELCDKITPTSTWEKIQIVSTENPWAPSIVGIALLAATYYLYNRCSPSSSTNAQVNPNSSTAV